MFNTTVNIVIFYGYVSKVMCKSGQTVCVDFFFQFREAAVIIGMLYRMLFLANS